MRTTYTPIRRMLYPRHGIKVTDGVGSRVFWYPSRRIRDAFMANVAAQAARGATS